MTKHLIKPTETLGRERTEAEKQQDYSKATEELLYIRGVDRLLKRLLREEIDISEFIEHAESKQIATREFNRYFQGEIDFFDYIDWLRENAELVESASEFDDDE